MKLGKALATGVAEEQPQVYDEEVVRPAEVVLPEETSDLRATAAEEVPAAR